MDRARSRSGAKAGYMRLRRLGRLLQPRVETGTDLAHLPGLDPKLWVALASPAQGLEFDARTLSLLDVDNDGRIRRRDLVQAIQWVRGLVKDPSVLDDASPEIALDQIDTSTPEGERLLASAQRILKNLGKRDSTTIALADALSSDRILAASRANGDGIITVDSARDADERLVIEDVIACIDGVADRSGGKGIGSEQLQAFWQELGDYVAWLDSGVEATAKLQQRLGGEPEAALKAFKAVEAQIDSFFAKVELCRFDPHAADELNRPLRNWEGLANQDAATIRQSLRALPLALVNEDAALPLDDTVNPAWQAELDAFRERVVRPLIHSDADSIESAQWNAVKDALHPYSAWVASKPQLRVECLGAEHIRELLSSNLRDRVQELIARDVAVATEIDGVALVEKLLRFKRDLLVFVNNFAAMPYFYGMRNQCVFQAGTLYLDGRAMQLCVGVDDVKKHSVLAEKGGIFLLYCQLVRGKEQRKIAAAVTAGTAKRLIVGRNGLFYDRQGQEWDATVTQLIQQPISLREAALAPFVRLWTLISEQFEKLSSAREAAIRKNLSDDLAAADKQIGSTPPDPATLEQQAQARRAGIGGLLAGGGLAVAALSSAFAFVSSTLARINPIYLLYTLIFFIIVIVGPSTLIAWIRLRRRDVGMLLEAGGWAINGPIPLNRKLSAHLTELVPLGDRTFPGKVPVQDSEAAAINAPQ